MSLRSGTADASRMGRADLVPVLGLLLFTLLIHAGQIFGGEVFYAEDVQSVFGPSRSLVGEFLGRGEIPFWNIYAFGGSPLFGNPENAVLYPLTAIFAVLPLVTALKVSLVVHAVLAAFFSYICIRVVFRVRPLAAFLGAAVFTFSSYYPHHMVHHRDVVSVPWLPLAFLLLDRCFAWRGWASVSAAGGLALTLGVQLLGGATQTSLLTYSLLGLYAGWRLFAALLGGRGREAGRIAVLTAVPLALGAGIAAVQILPSMTLVGESFRRSGVSYEFASYLSIPPPQAGVSLFLPHLFGRWGEDWWGRYTMHETILFVGVLPVFLGLLAFRLGRRAHGAWFLIVLGIFSLVLAFGKWTPVFRALYDWVPGYDMFRVPARFSLLFCFAAAGLTAVVTQAIFSGGVFDRGARKFVLWSAITIGAVLGFGSVAVTAFPDQCVDVGLAGARILKGGAVLAERQDMYEGLLRGIVEKGRAAWMGSTTWQAGSVLLFVASVLALLRALAGRRGAAALVTVVLLADLFYFSMGAPIRHLVPDEMVNRRTPLIAWLQERLDDERVDERRSPTLKWNRNVPHRIRAVDGRNLGIYPMLRYKELLEVLDAGHPRLLDMMRVKYVIVGPEEEAPAGLRRVFASGGETIYENDDILPPAWFPAEVEARPDAGSVLAEIAKPDFDPRRTAWVEGVELPPVAGAGATVELSSLGAREVRYRVAAPSSGLLVTAERWYPGWEARIDGEEVAVLPVNGVLRGVVVNAGEHEVVFRFRERRFARGLAISGGSLLAALLLLVLGVWRRRSVRGEAAGAKSPGEPGPCD